MQHKVYQRDWYFNAGIVGFIRVIFDGESPVKNGSFDYGDNYFTFDNTALASFEEKFIKQAFFSLFRMLPYIWHV